MKAYYNGLITDYCSLSIPISDRSVFFVSAEIEMLRTRAKLPWPVVVIIIRTEKYIAKITATIKYNQNQIERFIDLIIS